MTKSEDPLRTDLLEVLNSRGVRGDRGVVVRVQPLDRGVRANMGADGVCIDDPGLMVNVSGHSQIYGRSSATSNDLRGQAGKGHRPAQ